MARPKRSSAPCSSALRSGGHLTAGLRAAAALRRAAPHDLVVAIHLLAGPRAPLADLGAQPEVAVSLPAANFMVRNSDFHGEVCRLQAGTKCARASFIAEPRSGYLLRGPSRTEWEHSIPAVDALRYSITFRTFRAAEGHVVPTAASSRTA